MVIRDAGTMYLAPLAQDVRQIRAGVDKTAAELAVARLTKEVADIQSALDSTLEKTDDDWIRPSDTEVLFPKITAVTLIFAALFAMNISGILGGLTLMAAIVIYGTYMHKKQKRTERVTTLRDNEVRRLQASLNERTAALKKNRRIAEG